MCAQPFATAKTTLVTIVLRTSIAFVMITLVIVVTTPPASTPETTRQT